MSLEVTGLHGFARVCLKKSFNAGATDRISLPGFTVQPPILSHQILGAGLTVR